MKNILFLLGFILFWSCQDDELIRDVQACNHVSELPALENIGFNLSVVDMEEEYNGTFKKIQFISNTVGFLYATNNKGGYLDLFKTTDGGDTWNNLDLDVNIQPYGFYFKNEQEGFITSYAPENAAFYKTIDGGLTWERKDFPNYQGFFTGFDFDKNGDAYTLFSTIGGVHTLLKSIDNGDTWTAIFDNEAIKTTIDFSFKIEGDFIFMLGTNRAIFKIDLAGNLLKTIETTHSHSSDIKVFDENTMIVSGLYNIIKTIDGGETWTSISASDFQHVMVGFSSENQGLITRSKSLCPTDYILSDDVFAYTTNGGISWEESAISVNLTHNFENSYELPNGDYLMLGFKEMLRIKKL